MENSGTSLGVWRHVSDLENYPDSLHLHNSTLSADLNTAAAAATTMGKPKRSISLRSYHKPFYHDDEYVVSDDRGRKKLKRKNGASNLNQTPSVSATSSPPPLSPSYSMSVMSQRSGQDHDSLDGFLFSRTSSPQACSEYAFPRKTSTRLNTFRDRLRKPSISRRPSLGHNKARSDSLLLDFQRSKTTMVHQGTSFEILNPHESLNFARIVSYIEDVDYSSRASSDRRRESFLSASSIGTMALKPEKEVPPLNEMPGRRPDICSAEHHDTGGDGAHSDLVGDVAHAPIPSISERLGSNKESSHERWDSNGLSNPSDLGEPGPCEENVSINGSGRDGHTVDSHAWPLPGNLPSQSAHEKAQYQTRPMSNYQAQQKEKKRSFHRLRKIVRGMGFMRRKGGLHGPGQK